MGSIIVWLLFTAVSFFILYLVVKTAINHSDLPYEQEMIVMLSNQLERQHVENSKQLEELKQIIQTENRILGELQVHKSEGKE
ncbi:hypothetical protein [Paenibacillus lutrae]|uniref:Uncharacterized protein n=1 Tax=Paenibacillus lutrae TaxID=2078573 RepID=A0A7X3FK46_9BACL|nr:hypothetical protein [Paenibacillus lutrae]MVP01166.1 hypothetical protein [Paenibacillus lutrae]